MDDMDELKERIEGQLVTRTFNISGMPESVWKEVDSFCRNNYGDVRWVMVKDLMSLAEIDWKYEMLATEIQMLKEALAERTEQKGVDLNQKPTVKSFGAQPVKKVMGDRYD